jgi:hypothetical protein
MTSENYYFDSYSHFGEQLGCFVRTAAGSPWVLSGSNLMLLDASWFKQQPALQPLVLHALSPRMFIF